MYVEPYELTKLDIAALRKCDHIVVRKDPEAKVYCIKNAKKTLDDPFATDIHFNIAAPVSIANRWDIDSTRATAFELLWNYPTQVTQLGSILATLRAGDGVKFLFDPDGHSTQSLKEHGFHADCLKLEVYRGGKHVAEFDLAVKTCLDNTARMIKGSFKRVFNDTTEA